MRSVGPASWPVPLSRSISIHRWQAARSNPSASTGSAIAISADGLHENSFAAVATAIIRSESAKSTHRSRLLRPHRPPHDVQPVRLRNVPRSNLLLAWCHRYARSHTAVDQKLAHKRGRLQNLRVARSE